MSNPDDLINVYPMTEFRTCRVNGDDKTVILMIKSGKDVRHYSLALADFSELARRIGFDAKLLAE